MGWRVNRDKSAEFSAALPAVGSLVSSCAMGIKIALPCKLSNGKPMSAPYKSGFFGRFGTEPLPAPDMFRGRVAFLSCCCGAADAGDRNFGGTNVCNLRGSRLTPVAYADCELLGIGSKFSSCIFFF
jgi:hypothetical protein